MSLIQIYSVIALLLAFNVPSAKVNDVRVILEKSAITAGVQIPATPVATGGAGDTSFVPADSSPVAQSPAPICDEQLDLSITPSGNGIPAYFQWGNPLPAKHLEQYYFNVKVNSKCGSDWIVDYDYDGWDGTDSEGYQVTRNMGKISDTDIPYVPFIKTMNPVAGTHTITATAHTKNGLATTSPVTVSYVSNGILSN